MPYDDHDSPLVLKVGDLCFCPTTLYRDLTPIYGASRRRVGWRHTCGGFLDDRSYTPPFGAPEYASTSAPTVGHEIVRVAAALGAIAILTLIGFWLVG